MWTTAGGTTRLSFNMGGMYDDGEELINNECDTLSAHEHPASMNIMEFKKL